MDLESFYALREGQATQIDGGQAHLSVMPLGKIRVPSGLLEASDPFAALGEGPVFEVEAGEYDAFVTLADVSPELDGSNEREAYLSVVLGEGTVASVAAATSTQGAPEQDAFWGVGVDASAVAFVDHEAIDRCMPDPTEDAPWSDVVFDHDGAGAWMSLLDSADHIREGMANIELPLAEAGENIVLAHSGWGDGFFPVLVTKDAEGNTLGLHIDLLVVGEPVTEEVEEDEGIPLIGGSVLKDDDTIEEPEADLSPSEPVWELEEPAAAPGASQPVGPEQWMQESPGQPADLGQSPEGEGLASLGFQSSEPAAPQQEPPAKKPGFFARLLNFFRGK